jgi:hypothetical protein
MGDQKQLSKRKRRIISAVIATTVTTLLALSAVSSADAQSCTIQDATNWQLAINDREQELSPDYIRTNTEAFLQACPERPEFYDASRIAGIAAADMGDPHAAAQHFRNAGRMTNLLSNFYAMGSFLAIGEERLAWRVRDMTVDAWRSRLDRHPHVSVAASAQKHGMIYQVNFATPDKEPKLRAAWVAVPNGPGWPATLGFSSDRMRLALKRTSSGSGGAVVEFIDLNRCLGRRTLGEVKTPMSTQMYQKTATASLNAYLASPDIPRGREKRDIQICTWPSRLLPGPPKGVY